MKYPKQQFEVLKRAVKQFKNHIDIEAINSHQLHYLVFQQFSDGQTHNRLVINEANQLTRQYRLDENNNMIETKGKLLIDFEAEFELYPQGCNDNHIETAMKNVIKQLTNH